MRTYYQLPVAGNSSGTPYVWVEIQTDANGNNDVVWLVTLIQTCLLNLGESPFYASYGIPGPQSVMQQVFPDYYIAQIQQTFAPYFVSLTIAKQPSTTPTYGIAAITHSGVLLSALVSEQGYLVDGEGNPITTTGGQEIAI